MKKIHASTDTRHTNVCIFSDQSEADRKVFLNALTRILSPDVYCADYEEAAEIDVSSFDLVVLLLNARAFEVDTPSIELLLKKCTEESVTLLPVLTEKSLDIPYNTLFGTRQFLLMYDDDPTVIPFPDKLAALLNESFVEKSTYEKVKRTYKASIFLSYRKKDRALARQLMQAIHERPIFRDVAIWFDEYITPGESWSKEIERAISEGDLFVLMVTPNLVNENNYVIRCEYPASRKQGKPCFALQMEEVPMKKLLKTFTGLKNVYSIDRPDDFFDDLKNSLGIEDHELSPEEKYLLGLAYLFGIITEKNVDYALAYIEDSANASFPDAMMRLSVINKNGIGKQVDAESAIFWKRKLVEYYENNKDFVRYRFALLDLAKCYDSFEMYIENCKIYLDERLDICYTSRIPDVKNRRPVHELKYLFQKAFYKLQGFFPEEDIELVRAECEETAIQTKETEDLKNLLSLSILYSNSFARNGEYIQGYSAFSRTADDMIRSLLNGSDYSAMILAFNYLLNKAESLLYIDEARRAKVELDHIEEKLHLLLPQDQVYLKARFHDISAAYYDTKDAGVRVFTCESSEKQYDLWIGDARSFAKQSDTLDAKMYYAKAMLGKNIFSLFNKRSLSKSDFAKADKIYTEIRKYSDRSDVRLDHARLFLTRGIMLSNKSKTEEAIADLKEAVALTEDLAANIHDRRAQRVHYIALAYLAELTETTDPAASLGYIDKIYKGISDIFFGTKRQGDFNNLLYSLDMYVKFWKKKGFIYNTHEYEAMQEKLKANFVNHLETLFGKVVSFHYTRFQLSYLPNYKKADY